MLRKVSLWEKISSFAHSEDRWVAKLECGHEVNTSEPGTDRPTELECPQCEDDPNWKQTLAIDVLDGDKIITRARFPLEIESDDDGPFAVIRPEQIIFPPGTKVTEMKLEIRSSNKEWQDRIRSAFLDRPEPGTSDA